MLPEAEVINFDPGNIDSPCSYRIVFEYSADSGGRMRAELVQRSLDNSENEFRHRLMSFHDNALDALKDLAEDINFGNADELYHKWEMRNILTVLHTWMNLGREGTM